jgi:hypothetical protein
MITSELSGDMIRENTYQFVRMQATPIKGMDGFTVMSLDYLPPALLRRLEADGGMYKSFAMGWSYCFDAIASVVRMNQAPTVTRVMEVLRQSRFDQRMVNHFFQKGGKVEYALDAVLQGTENVLKHGHDCPWEYETFEEDFEQIPENPLDKMYTLARVKCIPNCEGRGPYRESNEMNLE